MSTRTKARSSPGPASRTAPPLRVERVQLGVRIEKRLAKVLKGIAELNDQTLAEALEEIVLHAFEGHCAFGPNGLKKITELKKVYGLDYDTHASYRFIEEP